MTSKSIETPWSPVAERCRSCFKDDCLEPVYIDHDVYYVCRKCDYMTGIDDTMTDDDLLAAFLVTESWDVDDCGRGTRSGVSGVKINIAVCAGCGNDDINLLSIADCDKTTGNVTLTCLVCDKQMVVSLDYNNKGVSREMAEVNSSSKSGGAFSSDPDIDDYVVCDNDDSEIEDLGSSFQVIDEQEEASVYSEGGEDESSGRERVSNLDRLRRGDHISWHKWYAIRHHAIVVEADASHGQLTVIHNNGTVKPLNGKIASVRLETIEVDPVREELYRHVYRLSTCYPPDEVVQRAASRLGQTYKPFTFNCEHFARWCKTGSKKSEQVKKFFGRVTNAGLRGLGRVTSAARGVKGGPLVAGLVICVVVDSANFAVEAKEAYRKYRAGEISKDDFRQQLAKHGCEAVGGVVGAMIGGVVGHLVIPVPFIGAFIGCTLGNLVGRWCGAMIGKQLVKVK